MSGQEFCHVGEPPRCCLLHPNSIALKYPQYFLTQLKQTFSFTSVSRQMQEKLIWLCEDPLERTGEQV